MSQPKLNGSVIYLGLSHGWVIMDVITPAYPQHKVGLPIFYNLWASVVIVMNNNIWNNV